MYNRSFTYPIALSALLTIGRRRSPTDAALIASDLGNVEYIDLHVEHLGKLAKNPLPANDQGKAAPISFPAIGYFSHGFHDYPAKTV